MTLVERAERVPAGAAPHPAGRPSRPLSRLWTAPVGAHLVALAVVLVALIPVVGANASFSADEGAAIVQAKSLAAGHGWIVDHPARDLDPTSRYYPLELSDKGPKGMAPFAKHPLYALAMAAADKAGGVAAMVALSVLGTLAAAAATAALAGRLDPALRRPALWTVGIASPLLFDGYLVIGHALGAAAVAGAALVAVVALERRSVALAAATAPLIALAVLLRTEATLLAVALALVAGAIAWRSFRRDRDLRWPAAVLGVTAFGTAAVTRVAESAWASATVGGRLVGSNPADPYGFLGGRVHSFVLTWLRPSYDGPRGFDVAMVMMLAGVALGVFVARRHPGDARGIRIAAALAVAGALAGLWVSPHNLVPGLLVAFPVGAAGLLAMNREALKTDAARLFFGTVALFSLAVIATQYAAGGTAEWGGRYFAVGVPVLVPVALLALRNVGTRLAAESRRIAAAALVACSLVMAAMGIGSIRGTHQFTARLMSQIDRAGQSQATGRPVMVATLGAIPRLAWSTWDRQRWLLVPSDELGTFLSALPSHGVHEVTLVSHDETADRAKLGAGATVTGATPTPGNGWAILSLKLV